MASKQMFDPIRDNYTGGSTLLAGKTGPRDRNIAQPGDRMPNGQVWTGDTKLNGLHAQYEKLTGDIKTLQKKLALIEAETESFEQAMIDAGTLNAKLAKFAKPKSSPRKTTKKSTPAKKKTNEPAKSDAQSDDSSGK